MSLKDGAELAWGLGGVAQACRLIVDNWDTDPNIKRIINSFTAKLEAKKVSPTTVRIFKDDLKSILEAVAETAEGEDA